MGSKCEMYHYNLNSQIDIYIVSCWDNLYYIYMRAVYHVEGIRSAVLERRKFHTNILCIGGPYSTIGHFDQSYIRLSNMLVTPIKINFYEGRLCSMEGGRQALFQTI